MKGIDVWGEGYNNKLTFLRKEEQALSLRVNCSMLYEFNSWWSMITLMTKLMIKGNNVPESIYQPRITFQWFAVFPPQHDPFYQLIFLGGFMYLWYHNTCPIHERAWQYNLYSFFLIILCNNQGFCENLQVHSNCTNHHFFKIMLQIELFYQRASALWYMGGNVDFWPGCQTT